MKKSSAGGGCSGCQKRSNVKTAMQHTGKGIGKSSTFGVVKHMGGGTTPHSSPSNGSKMTMAGRKRGH
jgi:hypothetical protein